MDQGILYDELRQRSPALAESLTEIRKRALEIWREQSHPAFTAHGEEHFAQVEKNLDRLARPLQAGGSPLSAPEIYVLLAACHLHDIGMQLGVPDAREKHAEHSFDLILDSFASRNRDLYVRLPSLSDINAREAIAQVARGHWTSFALELQPVDYIYGNEKGRLRLLGALLAMADLLDISPVRARYFRSPHRLFNLSPLSELHQTTHHLVKGFDINPPDPLVPGDLGFTVEWRDDSEDTRTISDWTLHWFTSQWRQLQPVLHQDSGGVLRWVTPCWARAVFRRPLGPPITLSPEARGILEAERKEQLRIDRDEFCQAFLDALRQGRRALFSLPLDSEGDGSPFSDWCTAQPRREGVRVARLDVRRSEAPDLASLLASILEQWGRHLHGHSEQAALLALREALAVEAKGVALVIAADSNSKLLDQLLHSLFEAHPKSTEAPCVVALFSTNAAGPDSVEGAALYRPAWSEVREADLEDHLQKNWGYNGTDARRLASEASELGLCRSPGLLYRYVERRGKVWENQP